jgi:DNA polymerase-3 subunit epsilon
MRHVFLDTETTGLRVEEGHRIIEVACIEMIDRKLTGRQLHHYINPDREVEAGAFAVHGISNEFLKDKPSFNAISQELMDFISGAELIIHNAPFDLAFLNNELILARQGWKSVTDYCGVLDTLQMARKLHVGQRNSLDALCKRYFIDNSKRDLHGALLDTHLLMQVYLAMTGGQGSFFDEATADNDSASTQKNGASSIAAVTHNSQLVVIQPTADELGEHEKYLASLKKQGKCLWGEG